MTRTSIAATSPSDVRRRILDAAIEHVALKGLAGITVRDVTVATGVNVAAVSYYFGSKEGMLKEVMLDVFGPVRTARSDALALVLDQHAPAAPSVEAILTALIRPLVEAPRGPDGGRTIVRMMQHLRATPTHPISAFVAQHFDYGAQSFIDALGRAMPGLTRPELIWRYEYARGAAIHMLTICDPLSSKLAILSGGGGMVDVGNDEIVLREILQCALGGIGAGAAWRPSDIALPATATATADPKRRRAKPRLVSAVS